MFDQAQNILTGVKYFWPWSKGDFTKIFWSRWIRHHGRTRHIFSFICLRDFLTFIKKISINKYFIIFFVILGHPWLSSLENMRSQPGIHHLTHRNMPDCLNSTCANSVSSTWNPGLFWSAMWLNGKSKIIQYGPIWPNVVQFDPIVFPIA